MKDKIFGSYGTFACKKCTKTIPSNCIKRHACGKVPLPKPTPAKEVAGVKCSRCEGLGHFARDCPKQEHCPGMED